MTSRILKSIVKGSIFALLFFALGVLTTVLYNIYDYHQWRLKFNIYQAMHRLEQVHKVSSDAEALHQMKKDVACEVDNYVMRNRELAFPVDQEFVDKTRLQINVSCE